MSFDDHVKQARIVFETAKQLDLQSGLPMNDPGGSAFVVSNQRMFAAGRVAEGNHRLGANVDRVAPSRRFGV